MTETDKYIEPRHGHVVQDKISGFVGVVNTIGEHISGCTRIGALPLGDSDEPQFTAGDEQFFYDTQLNVKDKDTEWAETDTVTSTDIELGQKVRSKVTGYEGRVMVINFMLFNCPNALVMQEDEESTWIDTPLLEVVDDRVPDIDVDGTMQETGRCMDTGGVMGE